MGHRSLAFKAASALTLATLLAGAPTARAADQCAKKWATKLLASSDFFAALALRGQVRPIQGVSVSPNGLVVSHRGRHFDLRGPSRFIQLDRGPQKTHAVVREVVKAGDGKYGVLVEDLTSHELTFVSQEELTSARPSPEAHERYRNGLTDQQKRTLKLFEDESGLLHAYAPKSFTQDVMAARAVTSASNFDSVADVPAEVPYPGYPKRVYKLAEYRELPVDKERIAHLKPGEIYIFVLTTSGQWRIVPSSTNAAKHLAVSEGKPVLAAGELRKRPDGEIELDLSSGTYMIGSDAQAMREPLGKAFEIATGKIPTLYPRGPWTKERRSWDEERPPEFDP